MWYWILQLEYFLIRSLSVAWSLERRIELWLSVTVWPRGHHEPQHFSLCHQKPHQCDQSADWPDTSRSNYWWWPGWETCFSGRSSDCSHRDDDLDEFLYSILQTVQNKRVKQTRWTFNVDKVEWFSKDLNRLFMVSWSWRWSDFIKSSRMDLSRHRFPLRLFSALSINWFFL